MLPTFFHKISKYFSENVSKNYENIFEVPFLNFHEQISYTKLKYGIYKVIRGGYTIGPLFAFIGDPFFSV